MISPKSLLTLPIDSICIVRSERQRSNIDFDKLVGSIKQHGLINPLLVRFDSTTSSYHLVAGERRLEACKSLGWTEIPCRDADQLTSTEAAILELEENVHRADLPWQDTARAISHIHKLNIASDPEWTLGETAYELSFSRPYISENIIVARELDNTKISSCASLNEAYNAICRRDARIAGDKLEELIQLPSQQEVEKITTTLTTTEAGPSIVVPLIPSKPPLPSIVDTILNISFFDWIETYSGPRFNFIHCDFPYGINKSSGKQGRGAELNNYDDTPELYEKLLETFCRNVHKIASVSCHVMFWYSARNQNKTRRIFRELCPQLKWQPFPLIWVKSDNSGIAADSLRQPRHVYETAFLGSFGGRQLVKIGADAYQAPTDIHLHPSTKPEPMLKFFFRMLVDENTTFFDPTCGSGASLRAAEVLNAKSTLGLEINFEYTEVARGELRKARLLRGVQS